VGGKDLGKKRVFEIFFRPPFTAKDCLLISKTDLII